MWHSSPFKPEVSAYPSGQIADGALYGRSEGGASRHRSDCEALPSQL